MFTIFFNDYLKQNLNACTFKWWIFVLKRNWKNFFMNEDGIILFFYQMREVGTVKPCKCEGRAVKTWEWEEKQFCLKLQTPYHQVSACICWFPLTIWPYFHHLVLWFHFKLFLQAWNQYHHGVLHLITLIQTVKVAFCVFSRFISLWFRCVTIFNSDVFEVDLLSKLPYPYIKKLD